MCKRHIKAAASAYLAPAVEALRRYGGWYVSMRAMHLKKEYPCHLLKSYLSEGEVT